MIIVNYRLHNIYNHLGDRPLGVPVGVLCVALIGMGRTTIVTLLLDLDPGPNQGRKLSSCRFL